MTADPASDFGRRLAALLDAAGAAHPRRLLGRATDGSSHVTLKVRAGDAVLAVRLPMPVPRLAAGLQEEYRVLQAVSDAGLAPRLLHFDVSDGAQVSHWHDGRVWGVSELEDEGRVEALAAQLQRLHAMRTDVAEFDLDAAVQGYRRTLTDAGATVEASVRARLDSLESLSDAFLRYREVGTLAHNDLVAGNLVGDGVPRLLDWEYAARNDRLFDVATLSGLHPLSARGRDALLDALAPDRFARERVSELERLVRLLAWAWARAEQVRRREDPRPVGWLRLLEPWLA